jgi:hypothetical protein
VSTPEGYYRLNAQEVWTDGDDVIVLGIPPREYEEENGHNCDDMGCGQCHVILRAEGIHKGFDLTTFSAGEEKP